MLKDPMLEWTRKLLISWSNINKDSLYEFIYSLDLSNMEKRVLVLRFIPDENDKIKTFKEIEYMYKRSHDNIMTIYTKALQKLLDSLGPRIY